MSVTVKVEFSGGLETVFHGRQQLSIALPTSDATTQTDATRNDVEQVEGTPDVGALIGILASQHAELRKAHLFALLPTTGAGSDGSSGSGTSAEPTSEQWAQARDVRPGILVLVNDDDWELEDGPLWRLREGDVVCFVSTLHGG